MAGQTLSGKGVMNWVETSDGSFTLTHAVHGQTYHNKQGAWSETQAVFVNPVLQHVAQWPEGGLRILDVGFGLGLNTLAWFDFALTNGNKIDVTSLESDDDLMDLPKPKGTTASSEALNFLQEYKDQWHLDDSPLKANLLVQDALLSLKVLQEAGVRFDVILQDAFSPDVNAELWDESYFKALAQVCAPGAFLTTYCAASQVQRNLKAAGFEIYKKPGFGGKRERIEGIFKGS